MNPSEPTNQNPIPTNDTPSLPLPPTDSVNPPPTTYTTAINPNPSSGTILPMAERPSDERCKELNLSEGEGIVCEVDRHPIGLVQLYGGAAIVIVALLAVLYFFIANKQTLGFKAMSDAGAILAVACLVIIIGLVTAIAASIYKMNRMVLTNESLIIITKLGLFNTASKTISLNKIEDVSYKQTGLLPTMFGYGSIVVSTMGDEGLEFKLAKSPKKNADYINNAHEQFERQHPGV